MTADPSPATAASGRRARRAFGGRAAATAALAAAAALLTVFIVLAVASGPDSALSAWDRRVSDAFIAWRTTGRSHLFYAATLLGNTPALAAFAFSAVVLLLVWGRRARALLVAGGLVIAWCLSEATKALVGRSRPPADEALIALPSSGSLPSGHALTTMVFLGLLVFLAFRWRGQRAGAKHRGAVAWAALTVAFAIGGLIGVSRVYLGVHWLSDVLAGWSLAGAWLLALLTLVLTGTWRRLRGRLRREAPSQSAAGSAEPDAASTRAGPRAPARPAARVAAVVFVVALCILALVVSAHIDPLLTDL